MLDSVVRCQGRSCSSLCHSNLLLITNSVDPFFKVLVTAPSSLSSRSPGGGTIRFVHCRWSSLPNARTAPRYQEERHCPSFSCDSGATPASKQPSVCRTVRSDTSVNSNSRQTAVVCPPKLVCARSTGALCFPLDEVRYLENATTRIRYQTSAPQNSRLHDQAGRAMRSPSTASLTP